MKHIAIIDFGSQYTHLIARNIREMNVLAKIYHSDLKIDDIKEEISGIILSGGPQSVNDNSMQIDPAIFTSGLPILGICFGHQLIAATFGGKVETHSTREYGRSLFTINGDSSLLTNIPANNTVWMSHADSVTQVPEGFTSIGSTDSCPVVAMANEEKKIYSLQFHPEVNHSEYGSQILKNFVQNICSAENNWKIENIIDDIIEKIKVQVQDKKVFILVSGGVDSNVSFALLTKALGEDRVLGLYIDTGFMRKDESAEILANYEKAGFHNLKTVNASQDFFAKLENIYDPEEKRHIIGQTFLDTKDKASQDLGLESEHWLLGQGTIYPDTIESGGTKHADTIKTHHNRVNAIQELLDKGLVVEPLVDFYKDEVRQIGRLLNLPEELINRHPFPGPGLAIRCLCHKKTEASEDLSSVNQEISELYQDKYDINFAPLPLKSVGVQGDNRTYAHPLAVWGDNNWDKLDEISNFTTNNSRNINRTILLLNPPEGQTPRFELPEQNLFLDQKRIALLQEIDDIVMNTTREQGLYDEIWQFPIILVPITDGSQKESIVLRPFVSRDVMTLNFARLEQKVLDLMTKRIMETNKISYVFYDITNKPPGTVEWE